MAKFAWEGRTKQGSTIKGETEAPNQEAVEKLLASQAIQLVSIKQKGSGLNIELQFLEAKAEVKDIVVFVRQFATMIDAGLPLVQCLDILGTQQEKASLRRVIMKIKEDVEGGSTFADALGKHPKIFDTLFVNLVAAGEVGGILDTILNRLAAYLEKNMKLRQQVKSAMTYPIVVLIVAFVVVALLMTKVIPTFSKMFEDMGGEMPGPTKVVIAMSDWFQANILYLLGGIFAFVMTYKAIRKTQKGEDVLDAMWLKAPLVGNVIRKTAVARFTRTLGTMLTSGVPIMEALEITAKSAGNRVIYYEVMRTRQAIGEGKTIAEPLKDSKVFPSMVVQMIAVGEATGAMDTMLNKIADFYDDEVDAAVASLTGAMEPLMITFLGVVVGGILIAMYLPIFEIAGNVG